MSVEDKKKEIENKLNNICEYDCKLPTNDMYCWDCKYNELINSLAIALEKIDELEENKQEMIKDAIYEALNKLWDNRHSAMVGAGGMRHFVLTNSSINDILKQYNINKTIDRMSKERDKLRQLVSECDDIIDSCNSAIDDFERGLDNISQYL